MFFKKQQEIERLEKEKELLQFENSTLQSSLYQIGGQLVTGSEIIASVKSGSDSPSNIFISRDPYIISLTVGHINSAIFKITNWISKYSWNNSDPALITFLENPNERESFTKIIRKTVRDLLRDSNAFWDTSNGFIYALPARQIVVRWDSNKNSSDEIGYEELKGKKKYSIMGNDGVEHALDSDNIIHFDLMPDTLQLRGYPIPSTIQNEIDLYYYKADYAKKKYNRNEKPDLIINVGPKADRTDALGIKQKIMNIFNRNEPILTNTEKLDVHEINQMDNFGAEYIAFQEWLRDFVYSTYLMSEQDQGKISSTKASSEGLQHQTQSGMIDPILDLIAEEYNRSIHHDNYGDLVWSPPDFDKKDDNSGDEIDDTKDNQDNMEIDDEV